MSILMAFAVFGLLHSWLASAGLKETMRQRIGARAYHGLYRISYNVFAIVTLLPVFLLMLNAPDRLLWQVDGVLLWVLRAVQAVGVVGTLVALLQTDLGHFGGLTQLRAYLKGEPLPLPDEGLRTDGLYGWMRHPLYVFSLLVLWFTPTLTENGLWFNLVATAYFIIGSYYEERRLVAMFGVAYVQYKQRVPWLPLPR